jgi:radical SAM protein with 4Fe4S-binding SPASM domain
MVEDLNKEVRDKNESVNKWEQYYRKLTLMSFPLHIQFPTGTRCNLRCRFCTERSGEAARHYAYEDLSFKEFCSIVERPGWERAFNTVRTTALYGWGEPLFNPEYDKIFDYMAHNFPHQSISISTNGTLFDQRWTERLLAAMNSDVNFSVNAATTDTYRILSGKNLFDRVVANIRYLTNKREQSDVEHPAVSLSYVATTENITELPQFVNLAADLLADTVVVQDVMRFNEKARKLSLENEPDLAQKMFNIARKQAELRKIRIGFISFETHEEDYFPNTFETEPDESNGIVEIGGGEEKPSINYFDEVPSPYKLITDCFDPWEKFMIRVDGEVFPCCRFQDSTKFGLGNIFRESFTDIWNGKAYRQLRRQINTEYPPEVCAHCPRKVGLD